MGILFVLIAAGFISISNLSMRRSIDAGGSSRAFLVIQLVIAFFVMVLLNPVRTENYTWSWPTVVFGLIGGLIFGLLMWSIGKTVEKGPPGLSFAVLNTSTVMPAVFMTLFFGTTYGHPYSLWNALGSVLVVIGLFWAGWTSNYNPHKVIWAGFATLMFFAHIAFLIYLQWWALVLKDDLPLSSLLPIHIDSAQVQWFMPSILFVGALIQFIVYLTKQQHFPKRNEWFYGVLGGVTNGISTFFLILAPQKALPWENAMIFPVFSVAIIIICNAWAQALYKEEINWKANAICVVGLIVGTVAWNAL